MTYPSAPRSCSFGPLVVTFDERVLEPRPWTLLQSEWAAALCAEAPAGPLLEICAGAGHIGLAAAVLADRDLVQVEADPVAAEFARANAHAAGWGNRVEVRTTGLEVALRADERFHVILADPPYLPTADLARWPDDPPKAIDGGSDGLDLVRACLSLAATHLEPRGLLLLQTAGPAQAERVDRLLGAPLAPGLRSLDLKMTDVDRAVLLIDRSG